MNLCASANKEIGYKMLSFIKKLFGTAKPAEAEAPYKVEAPAVAPVVEAPAPAVEVAPVVDFPVEAKKAPKAKKPAAAKKPRTKKAK